MYRRPRAVVSRHLGGGPREDRALLYAMLGCGLVFVGQWPKLARDAHLNPEVDLDMAIGGALLGWLCFMPLILYALAWLFHLVARGMGGHSTAARARLATFWAFLAAAPMWMFSGLAQGFMGDSPATDIVGLIALGVTGLFLVQGMREAASPPDRPIAPPHG